MQNRMPSVALVTWEELRDLAPSDRLLAAELTRLGVDVTPAVWSDSAVAWEAFDAVVLRSTWDYHLRAGEFRAWLDGLAARNARVFNDPSIVRWNMDKRYLQRMDSLGVATLPTVVLERGATDRIADVLRDRGWPRAVVKPAISASGWHTRVITIDDADDDVEIDDCGLLVQPFADEVVLEGEWSFIFIDGVLQLSVLKNAKEGDFRVQSNFGGTAAPVLAPSSLAEQASEALRRTAPDALYARVDGINRHGTFVLMELELIEPELFLSHEPAAATVLAKALLARLD
jgi:glutathione synthase/RimK-type ligase-like ATP-grasp enzyme